MSEHAYYLFFFHDNLKDFLLGELEIKYPKLKLSFSNKEFISMKGPVGLSNNLRQKPIIFARRQALFISKNLEMISELDILVGKEYWHYETIHTYIDTYDLIEMPIPEQAPARAWHKIDQAFRLFELEIRKGQSVIEIGSAPGGESYYILEKGAKLVSIDPAQMSPVITENYHNNFRHIKESVFEVTVKDLPSKCDWFISDLNLNGELNLKQSLRIMKMYPSLKGAFITIKTPKVSDLKKIFDWISMCSKYKKVFVFHLPAHRREIGLVILPS